MESPSDSGNKFVKYSGLGIQLLATIGIMAWLGLKLDAYLNLNFPAFLLTFSFLAFAGVMVQLYRSLNQK